MPTENQFKALTARVDSLLNRINDIGQENARLVEHIIALEGRVDVLEQGKRVRRDDAPTLTIEAAVARTAASLSGRLTLQDAAERMGLPLDRSTKIKLGKHLKALGFKQARSNESRFFCF